jgi:hypothetical protein
MYFKPSPEDNFDYQDDSMFGSNATAVHNESATDRKNPSNAADRGLMPPPPPPPPLPCKPASPSTPHQNPFDAMTPSAQASNNSFGSDDDHLRAFTAAVAHNIVDDEFRSGGDYFDELARDEQANRAEFADNNLTLNVDVNKQSKKSSNNPSDGALSSSSSSGNTSSSTEWWKNASHLNQASRLELSNVSWQNTSVISAPPTVATSSAKQPNGITVQDYFKKSSEMPAWVENATSSSDESNEKKSQKEEDGDSNDVTRLMDNDDMTFSNSMGNTPTSFSFTINMSDTGESLIPKSNNKSQSGADKPLLSQSSMPKIVIQNPTPPSQQVASSLPVKSSSENASSSTSTLKSIGEELERVTNRLASGGKIAEQNTTASASLTKSKSSASVATGNARSHIPTRNRNDRSQHMDETISSIGSTTDTTGELFKAKSGTVLIDQSANSTALSNTTSSIGVGGQSSGKGGGSGGSLTSTPSKLLKSSSVSSDLTTGCDGPVSSGKHMMDKIYKSDSSSAGHAMRKGGEKSSAQQHHHHHHHDEQHSSHHNHLFGQESFISSIPEKSDETSDSTLLGMGGPHNFHHQQQRHNGNGNSQQRHSVHKHSYSNQSKQNSVSLVFVSVGTRSNSV